MTNLYLSYYWSCNTLLLSNSENREHLENFRNVDCVLANHSKVQDTQANLTVTVAVCGLIILRVIGFLLTAQ